MDKKVHINFKDLSLNISGLQILKNISFNAYKGELLALIGPNGAGKTSLLNCISGIYHASSGTINVAGTRLVGMKPHEIAEINIARTFQHAELFRRMTVLQNLLSGRHIMMKTGVITNGLFSKKTRNEEIAHREEVEKIIRFLELERYRKKPAGDLAYGIQKIVGLGRALAMNPAVLLLDEPSAGMNRQEKEDLARFILRIKYEMKITMIWVEHDMQMVGDLADRVVVLNFGTKIAEGEPDNVLADRQVIEAYLGSRVTEEMYA